MNDMANLAELNQTNNNLLSDNNNYKSQINLLTDMNEKLRQKINEYEKENKSLKEIASILIRKNKFSNFKEYKEKFKQIALCYGVGTYRIENFDLKKYFDNSDNNLHETNA